MEKNNQTKFKSVFALLMIFFMIDGYAQTYFASTAGGRWASGAAWSTASCGSGGIVYPNTTAINATISCANKTITADSSVNPQQCNVLTLSTGTLVVNSGITVTATTLTMTGGTLTVNGTLFVTGNISITGGTVNGTGTIVLGGANQNISSTVAIPLLNVTGTGTKTMLSSLTVGTTLSLTGATLAVGSNTLTVGTSTTGTNILGTNGRILTTSGSSLNFGGSVVKTLSAILSNTGAMTLANFTMTKSTAAITLGAAQNLTVTGAFTLNAGDFVIGSNTLTLNGAILGDSDGMIIGSATSDLVIGGSGTASMFFDKATTTANTIRNFTNNRTSHSFGLLSSLTIGGVLTEVTNASISLATVTSNPLSIAGTVSGSAKLIGHSNASLNIVGSGAMGGTLTFVSTPTLNSLTMNRTSSGTATIGSAISVDNLTLTNGVLTNANLTTITGSAPNKIANSNAASYLAGPLARTIGTNSNSAQYIFPIGKTAPQKLTFNGLTTGSSSNVVISAEAFDGNSNGTFDATMDSRNTDNYWSAVAIANASSLVAVGTVSLNDASIAAGSVVGYASTRNGIYTSLGGTVVSQTITSVDDAPVGLGFYNLGGGGAACDAADVPTINASATTNCAAMATTLSIASGALNSATNWHWYSGSCGSTLVGTGTSISVSPSVTTTYFVRGEGGCVTAGTCATITITVLPQSVGGNIFGVTGTCVGTPSSQMTLTGYTGNIMRWESAVSPFSEWTTINNTTATYTSGNLFEDTRFRAIVKNGVCAEVVSAPITITVSPETIGGSISGETSICLGTPSSPLTLSGFTGNVMRWESAVSPFTTWNTINNTSATYTPATLSETTRFRAIVKSGACEEVASASITVNVSPQSVGGSISGGTGACLGTPSSELTLLGYTGNIIRWESAVSPFTTWTTINNTSAIYTSGNLFEETRFRAVVKSGVCSETISASIAVVINQVTFGAASTEIVCPNTDASVTVTGLVPSSVSTITYIKNPGAVPSSREVVANELGTGVFKVLVTGAGQSITISSITRTDSNPNCPLFLTTNNTVAFPVASGCTQVGAQCGEELAAIDAYVYANVPSPSAQSYIWRVTTLDVNGNVVPSLSPQLISTAIRNFKISQLPSYAFNTNYRVEVSVVRNNSQGPYGKACVIKTPSPVTQLTVCDASLAAMNTTMYATSVPCATGYRFTITEDITGQVAILYRPIRDFKLTSIVEFTPKYGTIYRVKVAVRNSDGTYLSDSVECQVTTPVYPVTVFAQSDEVCDAGYVVPSYNTSIYGVSVSGAVKYEFTVSGEGLLGGSGVQNLSIIKQVRSFTLQEFVNNGATFTGSAAYSVWVKPVFDPAMTSAELLQVPSGHACTIIAPAGLGRDAIVGKDTFNVVAYPNPFADAFGIDLVTPSEDRIQVKVYDMTGRLLDEKTAAVSDVQSLQVGGKYPSGVYNVIVTQGENVKTLRLIKR